MARTIQIFEHEKLTLHEDNKGRYLTEAELSKLYEYNDNHDNIYFTGIRDGIKLSSYVGVIQIGGLTLEILPKADKVPIQDTEEYIKSADQWQKALLRMLSVCQYITVKSVSEAQLNQRSNSILDLYFDLFLNEVEILLHRGLIKKYNRKSGNLGALRGRLNFQKNIQQNVAHQERFYTDHQVYDHNHLVNQILNRALLILNQISDNPNIKERLGRLKLDFPVVERKNIQAYHFDKIQDDRKTVHYSRALSIAKMLILNYSPDIRLGDKNMLALLFDMNKLWEEYVYRMLLKSKRPDTYVSFQNSKVFWQSSSTNKSIRPDLVVSRGEEKFIVDTKWKIIDHRKPGDDDLKQMYAYNMYWDASLSLLLYPRSNQHHEPIGDFLVGKSGDNQCKLGFVNVLADNGQLDAQIGNKILSKIGIHYN